MPATGTGSSGRGGGGMMPGGMPGPMDMGEYHHHHHQVHQNNSHHHHHITQLPTHTNNHHPLAQHQQHQQPQYGTQGHGGMQGHTSAAAAASVIRGRLASSAGIEDLIAAGASSQGSSSSAAAAVAMRRHSLAATSISSPISPVSVQDPGNNGMMNSIQIGNNMTSSPPGAPSTAGMTMSASSSQGLLLQQGIHMSTSANNSSNNLNSPLLQMPLPMTANIPPHGHGHGPKPIRRRMRMITSCLECRRRKLKCNKSQPCTNCIKFNRECLYLGPKLDEASQLRLTEIKEKVGSLERQLERDVAKGSTSSATSSSLAAAAGIGLRGAAGAGFPQEYSQVQGAPGLNQGPYQHQNHHPRQQRNLAADQVEDDLDTEVDLEITPMVALDLTYEDDADGTMPTDDLIDLGIQVGRMRITERIGGLNRPRISEEIQAGLGQGPSSPMFNIPLPTSASSSSGNNTTNTVATTTNNNNSGSVPSSSSSDFEIPEFLRPGASYIPPTSGFFFGQVLQAPSLLHFLPGQAIGDKLMMRYFEAVHPIARCVHRPSFEPIYASFWDDVNQGFEPRASVQALVFAAWFSAAVSLADDNEAAQVTSLPGSEMYFSRSQLVENMKVGTEAALSKANFLRTTRVETMQAFVMYMLPLCRDEVSRAHSVLVGAAVRMAECMGLHRDGQAYGLNPLETHVRRLIWHQLCFLDIRTCEAQGPKPGIRRDDYDTTLPLNVEEDELTNLGWASVPPSGGAEKWTSNLLSIIRFEINEMMRIIWSDRRKIETTPGRRTNLPAVLVKIENFRKRMLEKYDHILDDKVPIQRYTKLVMNLLIYRLHCMVLHPYHTNTSNPMPERLTHVLLMSGVMIIEISMYLERNPLFNKQWGWYTGAYQQFQIALLLATEIYYRPDGSANGCPGAASGAGNGNGSGGSSQIVDRIWGCLDYVFDLDPSMDRAQKSFLILSEIMSKTGVYMSMRKMRAPVGIAQAIPEREAVRGSSSAGSPGPQQQHQDVQMGQGGQAGSPSPGSSSSSSSGGSTIHPDNPNLKVEPGLVELGVPQQSLQQMDLDPAATCASSSSVADGANVGNSSMMTGLSNHQHQQQQVSQSQHHHHHHMPGQHFGQAPLSSQPPQGLGPNMHTGINQMMIMMMPPSGGIGPIGGPQGPFSNMVYAGVSNGEVLWGLPPGSHHHQHHHSSGSNGNNPGSPNSSDGGGSVAGGQPLSLAHHHHAHHGHQQMHNGGGNGSGSVNGLPLSPHGSGNGSAGSTNGNGNGNGMKDIDWETINMLFPADPQTGDFNFNMFVHDPSIQAGLMHHQNQNHNHQIQGQQSHQSQGQQHGGQNQQQLHQRQQQTPSTSAAGNTSSSSPTCSTSVSGGLGLAKNGSRAAGQGQGQGGGGGGVGKWAR